jgi:shikimate kinase
MNVTLIGMAGAGKSYIGKQVAQKMNLEFVDIDDVLEAQYGKSIQEILEEVGEQEYLEREARALVGATEGRDNLLVSPGGSVIYRDDAMEHIRTISKVVYLKVPYEIIEERKKDAPPRAVIGLGLKTLRELYDERHPLYEKNTDLVLEIGEMSNDEVIDAIAEYVAQG